MSSLLFVQYIKGILLIEVVRATYDAVLILAFFQLIAAYMGYIQDEGIDAAKIQDTIVRRGFIRWPILDFFLPCFPKWIVNTKKEANRVFNTLKFMCLQYTFVNFAFSSLIITIIAVAFVRSEKPDSKAINVNKKIY